MDLKNKKIDDYLKETCSLIKNKRVHTEVKDEIISHLTELYTHYKNLGNSDDECIDLSLKDLGSSTAIGTKLNKVHKAYIDFKMLIATLVLICIGFLGTLTFNNAYLNSAYPANSNFSILSNPYFIKEIIWFVISIALFFVGTKIDFRRLKKLSIPIYIYASIIIILCIFQRYSADGIYAGFILGFISISIVPSIPLLFLFALSGIYPKLKFKKVNHVILALIIGLVPLIAMSYDSKFIPLFIYYSIGILFLLYINSKNIKILLITGVIEVALFFVTSFKPLMSLIYGDIWSRSSISQILTTSKFVGKNAIPGSYINSSYPITSSIGYFGWLFGIIMIIALLYFVFRLIKISYFINNIYGKSLAFSISIVLSVETIWGILMNLNLLPYTGISTVLVSYGGSSMIVTLLSLGLLTNIYKVKTLSQV